jgi:uncharacterized Zn-finger protein
MGEDQNDKACAEQHYQVRPSALPLSCPTAEMATWNAHPRVYLDVKTHGHVTCPYCGASYELIND